MAKHLTDSDVRALIGKLGDPDERISRTASRELQTLVIRVRELCELLQHENVKVRECAIESLSVSQLRGREYPLIERAMSDRSGYVRVLALQALWNAPRL